MVQHAQQGDALARCKAAQQAHDVVGRFGVKARHRLVGEKHLRTLGERASNRHALRLTAGESAGALSGEIDGTVTEIGITYLKLSTVNGIISVPNSQVLNAAVGPLPPGDYPEIGRAHV